MRDTIEKKLFSFQVPHADALCDALATGNVLDMSDTGTGKTYCAIAACAQLNLIPIIICPKIIKAGWIDVIQHFGIKDWYVNNIEQYRLSKTPYVRQIKEHKGKKYFNFFKWNEQQLLTKDNVLIIDEAHCVKNALSISSCMMKHFIRQAPCKALFLSATIAESAINIGVVGEALGIFGKNEFFTWCYDNGVKRQWIKIENKKNI